MIGALEHVSLNYEAMNFFGIYIWVFPKIGVPQNRWFIMENPIKMDDLEVPLFLETPILNFQAYHNPKKKHWDPDESSPSDTAIFSRVNWDVPDRKLGSKWLGSMGYFAYPP